MKRVEASVYGRVQGVSFRHYTQQEARRLKLTGWVKNEPDGTVKVVAEGAEEVLKQLVAWLHIGSPFGHVDRVETTWHEAANEYQDFRVRWYE